MKKVNQEKIEQEISRLKDSINENNGCKSWNKWRIKQSQQKLTLKNIDLSQLNLSGIVLNNIILNGANLSHTNLEGAQLSKVSLRGAQLDCANLKKVRFDKTKLTINQLKQCKSIEDTQGIDVALLVKLSRTAPKLTKWREKSAISALELSLDKKLECKKFIKKRINGYEYCLDMEYFLKKLQKTPLSSEKIIRSHLDIIKCVGKAQREELKQFVLEGFTSYADNAAPIIENFLTNGVTKVDSSVDYSVFTDNMQQRDNKEALLKRTLLKDEIPVKEWEKAENMALFYLYDGLNNEYIAFDEENKKWNIAKRGKVALKNNYFYIR